MDKIKVVMDPRQRQKYIDKILALDGLSHISEDPNAAYCPISLTGVPDELKPFLKHRQEILMDNVLTTAGITAYDPGTGKYSPDTNKKSLPNEVYTGDSEKIVGARFFVGHNIIPSSGVGIEAEKAKTLNRIAVTLIDSNIRVSRMQPHRAIYLQYDNFEKQADQFAQVFQLLQCYEPGMGFNGDLPVLLGFPKNGGSPIDLENKVYKEFQHLQYKYNGETPILKFKAENPEIFYEKTA